MRVAAVLGGAFTAIGLSLVATAAPAAAHTVIGAQPTNYDSVLVGPVPPLPGITVRLRELGTLVEVVNATTTDLIVLGYQREPYLRIGRAGAFENRRSPTYYQNQVTIPGATATIPPEATPAAVPDWHRIGGGRTLRWRDQRTRHEGPTAPTVRADRHVAHIVSQWSLPMQWGTTTTEAIGFIRWSPPPNPVPWLALSAAVALTGIAAMFGRQAIPVLIGALAMLVGVDIMHAVVADSPTTNSVIGAFGGILLFNWYSLIGWTAGIAAIDFLERKRADGLFLAIFAGAGLLLFGGAGSASVLTNSQIGYAVQAPLARLAVSLTLGASIAVIVGAILQLRRNGVTDQHPLE